ncbi:phosphonate C-P lyase system protein PhnG [Mesorhizobium sp. NBSH29]|uniref:phosphonate C-P lyase system protein PhnG n=1 Tax=Mesorhizobium sp. NBSH29 TaxID=2654249 RepID=UPI0018965177|nr:phosphonate C-P lyase system protein PhnG [Mesorhizobium sp. NBSH29]QPC86166.1 phosphonate C-P lyase system protein PhnG [Mesorhizobium sp. NBSH29]
MKSDRGHEKATEAARKAAMATLAAAPVETLRALCATLDMPQDVIFLRGPETGLVTVRGRIGGGGAPFNFGEATVTRATVRLADGAIGHAYALGRDREKARLSAIADALWQNPEHRLRVEEKLITPLRAAQSTADTKKRHETAATRVDFFTMVRGED